MIDYQKLKKSLMRLEEQYQNYLQSNTNETLSLLVKDAIRESVIRRFETCYDSVWKHLKKYLEQELGLPDVPNSPRPIFRIANENNLLRDIEKWFEYGQSRIDTSHDYSGEKAGIALERVGDFLEDTILLYEKLTKEIWEH
ncbi:MAG: HI0074 family nucleotidyltransferase substrate-binding subunit [Leptospiraceae bacterium]|nr:HI0074 family nucleotidyltransferase substrate-binding subunit [Leptospiraceae bacterium]